MTASVPNCCQTRTTSFSANKGGFVPFSDHDKLKEIEREISMRCSVYPQRVASKAMRQQDADRLIAILEEIREGDGPLFGENS